MIVMDYLKNRSLEELIMHDRVTLNKAQIVKLALDVAKGLKYLHSCNTIHRDLKCSNVLLYEHKTRAKLSDFCTVRVISKSSKAKTVVGTIGYMAPEVLQDLPFDSRADVYSFGALLFQMITMTPLPLIFVEKVRAKKIKSVVADKQLQKLIIKCCKTEPSNRPSVDACIDELKQTLEKLTK
eukprot:TRINITY_DN4344_c0_g1_i1.p2 TRINITY_DN4344_c0_g1~~TRINITY_DN4344_c0_g1_i1.p2  ORF type:complete len:182 (+),score=38.06 TRINITY_DN4344_c0_g1_i1:1223-1768(+)